MPDTIGYVGTIEVETRGVSRLWFSLTEGSQKAEWVQIAGKRAWFTLNLESSERPYYFAELTLILEAMRADCQVRVVHEGAASFQKTVAGDSFEVTGVRILRSPMTFS